MVERVDGVVGLVHALKRVGDVVVDRQLRGESRTKSTKHSCTVKQNKTKIKILRERSNEMLSLRPVAR